MQACYVTSVAMQSRTLHACLACKPLHTDQVNQLVSFPQQHISTHVCISLLMVEEYHSGVYEESTK